MLGEVLSTRHIIEHASVLVKARVLARTADAQGIVRFVTDSARVVLAS